jgi:hypothetical protein
VTDRLAQAVTLRGVGDYLGGDSRAAAMAGADALEAVARGDAPVLPVGWTAVKREPTDAMAKRFLEAFEKKGFGAAWAAACAVCLEPPR